MTKDLNVSPSENPQEESVEVKEEANKVTFADLGLKSELLDNLSKLGFEHPTEIQEKAIPEVLGGSKDVLGIAQTGTGKTAAFGLPMLNMLDLKNKDIQGLVVAPTRELAIQITDELNRLKGKLRCSIATVYGGQSYDVQFRKLRDKPAIVVGTPGRLIDHLNRKSIRLSSLRFLVLDEADDMLNMGFVDDVEKILEHSPEEKQMLLFSATMPRELKKIVNKYMSEEKVEVVVKKKKHKQLLLYLNTTWTFTEKINFKL